MNKDAIITNELLLAILSHLNTIGIILAEGHQSSPSHESIDGLIKKDQEAFEALTDAITSRIKEALNEN